MISQKMGAVIPRLYQPVDIASLVFFRIAFGLIMFWEVCRYLFLDWIGELYIRPNFHFKYPGFNWVSMLPGEWLYVHFYLLGILSLMIAIGLFYRLATILFFLGFTYFFLIESAFYLNHLYLVCLVSFLIIWIPLHRNYSLDVLLLPKIKSYFLPSCYLWILRFQIGIVYFYGGIAKIEIDWLMGKPMNVWINDWAYLPIVGPYFKEPLVTIFYSWSGMIFDIFLPFALLFKKFRLTAFFCAVLFHMHNQFFFTIGIFPMLAIAMTSLFFEPSFPRELFHKIKNGKLEKVERNNFTEKNILQFPKNQLIKWFIGIYILWQLLMPLRHWIYPGWVNWNEAGHRFSWRMMLREKTARMTYFVTHPDTGETRHAYPSDYLIYAQVKTLQYKPDMMVQFGKYLRQLVKINSGFDPIVKVAVEVSLNGRAFKPYTNPNLDIGKFTSGNELEKLILPFKKLKTE